MTDIARKNICNQIKDILPMFPALFLDGERQDASVYFLGNTSIICKVFHSDIRHHFTPEVQQLITEIINGNLFVFKKLTTAFDPLIGTEIFISVEPLVHNPLHNPLHNPKK
jgi:hypothetical protein